MQKGWIGDIPNTHVRDFQRNQVYKAEDSSLFWGDTQIMTWEQVEDIVYKISQWAEIKPPEIVEDGHKITYATQDKISFTYPSLKTLPYICHEMSHVINYNGTDADHHGENFAGTYLEVVKHFIGNQAYKDLKHSFTVYGVKYKYIIKLKS
jgi:hypothetical protein